MREKQPPTPSTSMRSVMTKSRAATTTTTVMTTTRSRATRSPTTTTTTARAATAAKAPANATTRSGGGTRTQPSTTRATTPRARVTNEKPTTPKATTATEPETSTRVDGVKSEPRRGSGSLSDSLGPPPSSARPLRRTVSNIMTDAEEVRRLRTQLQGMKEQVVFMHRMMKGLSIPERQQLPREADRLDASTASSLGSKRLSFSGISPVKKTRGSVEVLVMPDDQNPFQEPKWKRPSIPVHRALSLGEPTKLSQSTGSAATELTRELASKLDAVQLQNASLTAQLQQHTQLMASTKAEYEAQLEDAAAKLAVIDAENLQLHVHVDEYEEENLRLHAALAEMGNTNNQLDDTTHGLDTSDFLDDELGIDGLGPEPEDAHERCDAKIHELWQTIKTLKAYVESFRVENEDLRVQRDTAIASAERAWQENSKLAGNNNPQQKIKYVENIKQENAELMQQVRELQSKLTKKQFKRGGKPKDKGDRDSVLSDESEPLDEYPSMESADDHSDDGSYEERTKLLKKMWTRNKKLEEEINRLQKEKQALVTRQPPRSPSVDSKQSRQSSQSSATRSTVRSTTPRSNPQSTTSSRWKK